MYIIPEPSSQQLPATVLHICHISAHYYYYFGCYSIPHSFSQRVGVQCRYSGVADDCLEPAPCAYSYCFLGVVDDNLWLCTQLKHCYYWFTVVEWREWQNCSCVWMTGVCMKFPTPCSPSVRMSCTKGVYHTICLTGRYHHHHVPEGLGMLACSLILKMKLVPPSLPRSSYVSSSVWFIL